MRRNVSISYKGKPVFKRIFIKGTVTDKSESTAHSCFIYVVNDGLVMDQVNQKTCINSKESLLKKCDNMISKVSANSTLNEVEVFAVYFHPSIVQEVFESSSFDFISDKPKSNGTLEFVANDLMDEFFRGLSIYTDHSDVIPEALAFLKFKEFMMLLLSSDNYRPMQSFLAVLVNSKVLEFSSIIEDNIYEAISLEELALLTNKSLSTFKRFFKEFYNDSPAKYIKRKRMERALNLLSFTDNLVSEIAYQCGYRDPSTFSKSFYSFYGTSPSGFRKTDDIQILEQVY